MASENGASNWLHVLRPTKYVCNSSELKFPNTLHLRYKNEPRKLPKTWAYGLDFTIAHALHFHEGGYTHLRHNEISDTHA